MPRKRVVHTTGPVAKAKPAPKLDTANILERFKDYPAIDVISRRFNNPNDPGSLPILLKDESADACVNTDHQLVLRPGATQCQKCQRPARKWYVRFGNTGQEGRWAQLRAKGYMPVDVGELMDSQDVADLVKGAGDSYVRRGDRGQEVLVKMPLELYLAVKRLQREQRDARMTSKASLTADLSEAAGHELGDEAGQTIHDGGIQVESLTRSRTTLHEEAIATDE